MNRRFTEINEPFDCVVCGRAVPPSDRTCRNHCPYCLHSLHVDINPGDRANPCKGVLVPVGYFLSGKKGVVIEFVCRRCGERTRNIALLEGEGVLDDYDVLLKLSPNG